MFCSYTMYKTLTISVVFLVVFGGILVAAQSNARNRTRCYQFTWLGPEFTNESIIQNATCQDATRLSDGIPCQLPLVASYDGTWPDIGYIWNTYGENLTCVLADSDVCAQYTYYFNGHVQNSTYMCTRALNANNTAITSGCYEMTSGSFSTRACLCRGVPGGIPCNSATMSSILPILTFILTIILILNAR